MDCLGRYTNVKLVSYTMRLLVNTCEIQSLTFYVENRWGGGRRGVCLVCETCQAAQITNGKNKYAPHT